MPAVQVRDFPDELYEELKAYAASQHRSVAQQLIVATEEMLGRNHAPIQDVRADAGSLWMTDGTEEERQARIEKRKAIFARIDKLVDDEKRKGTWIDVGDDEIVQMVHDGRDERDAQLFESLGMFAGEGGAR